MTLESPEEYQKIFEHTGTAMALIEPDDTISAVNQEFVRLAGISKQEIEGKRKWTSFVHDDDLERLLTNHTQRMTGKGKPASGYEFRFLDGKGTLHYTKATIGVFEQSRRTIASLIDITDHKERQFSLERRLTLEKIIADNSQNFINSKSEEIDSAINLVLKAVGDFAGVDRSYVFIFSEDEKTMSNTHEWCAEGVSPEIDMLQDLSVKEFSWIVSQLKAGVNINITDLEDLPEAAAPEKEILKAQDIISVAIVPLIYAGRLQGYLGFDSTHKQVFWSEEDFLLLRTIGNAIINALTRVRLEHQVLQSNKMDAIGRFAGGIAHDFNNILATIQGNSQLLSYSKSLSVKEMELVDTILQISETGSNLTRQLLSFSRDEPLTAERVHTHSILKRTTSMLERLVPSHINIQVELECTHDCIEIDPSQMEQIIMNLVLNSSDAMPEGGEITIHTENHDHGIFPGTYMLLQIGDNGHGMDPEITDKAVEPFFTTKSPEKGTGLGLSTVYSIIRRNSGYMEIFSTLGKGTRIDIYLPSFTCT